MPQRPWPQEERREEGKERCVSAYEVMDPSNVGITTAAKNPAARLKTSTEVTNYGSARRRWEQEIIGSELDCNPWSTHD